MSKKIAGIAALMAATALGDSGVKGWGYTPSMRTPPVIPNPDITVESGCTDYRKPRRNKGAAKRAKAKLYRGRK